MNSVKRFSGTYDLYASEVTIHGNLTVIGNTATLEVVDSVLYDKFLVLNGNESGAGVTGNYSGITVDRGSLANVSIRWNETVQSWQFTNDGTSWSGLGSGGGGGLSAAGADTQVQYNHSGAISASDQFTFDQSTNVMTVGSTLIGNSYITLENTSGPGATSNATSLYSNSVGAGGTGLYFVNTTTSDELISKSKATVLALIFS